MDVFSDSSRMEKFIAPPAQQSLISRWNIGTEVDLRTKHRSKRKAQHENGETRICCYFTYIEPFNELDLFGALESGVFRKASLRERETAYEDRGAKATARRSKSKN